MRGGAASDASLIDAHARGKEDAALRASPRAAQRLALRALDVAHSQLQRFDEAVSEYDKIVEEYSEQEMDQAA